MIGKTNAGGGGGGSGATLTITAPTGCTVTVSKDGKTKTRVADAAGIAEFKGLKTGTWTVTITKDGKTATKTVTITADYDTTLSFSAIPDFTYTGSYKITDDSGNEISVTQGNWRIRFLTSGTLTFSALNGADKGIDVFCVGGGAGGQRNADSGYGAIRTGGGGGYTTTTKKVSVTENTPYSVVVGAGGAFAYMPSGGYGNNGGKTSAFGCTANGGYAPYSGIGVLPGGNGGSGGGTEGGAGGSNGGDGSGAKSTDAYGNAIPSNCRGYGQHTTTRAFGESSGELFSSGGAGGSNSASGAANSGTGGGGGGGNGGSGIVIIRNARG